jgi:hypothetical protein
VINVGIILWVVFAADNSDIEAEFARGLGVMPSVDDRLSDDEVTEPTLEKKDEMKFVSSHFGDSTDDELEDTRLGRQMKFPDVQDLSLVEPTAGIRETANQIVSSVMGNALSGITNLAQKAVATEAKGYDVATGKEAVGQRSMGHQCSADLSDIDIAEEFDFLDEYEDEQS